MRNLWGEADLIVSCRGCGKLLKAKGEWQGSELFVMSTGSPVFGTCPEKRQFPACSDKFAADIIAFEDNLEGFPNSGIAPQPETEDYQ